MSRLDQYDIKSRLQDAVAQTEQRLIRVWRDYARNPAKLSRLQNVMIGLLVLWSLLSVSQLVWAPWRATTLDALPSEMINVPRSTAPADNVSIDISSVVGSGIFGGNPDMVTEENEASGPASGRDGIEAGGGAGERGRGGKGRNGGDGGEKGKGRELHLWNIICNV